MAFDIPNTLDYGHRAEQKTFQEQVLAVPGMGWMRFFFRDVSDRPSEVFVGQADQATLPVRVGAAMATINQSETFKATFTHAEYAAILSETKKLWSERSPARQAEFRANLARAMGQTMSKAAWNVLANAFDGAVTMGAGHDAKSLCATDHPIVVGSATTWSNKATAALSPASYAAARAAMLLQVSPSGELYEVPGPRFLIVPPGLRDTAFTLTRGLYLGKGTAGADNIAETNANPIVSDGLEVIESSILGGADANNWFLAREASDSGLTFIMQMMPQMNEGTNEETQTHWINGDMSFSCGWKTGRQVFGSEVV